MISREAKLPFEIVMLIIAAVIILITGAMLFPVYSGTLPYYENGLYGLLLIIFALQTITLGRTPFGDTPRSRLLLVVGLLIAIIGMVTSLIPISISFSRVLLFLCLGPGGLLLFLQMLFIKDKLKSWVKYGGIFRHLIFACSAVYILSMVIALLLWKQNLLTTPMTAVVILFFGTAVFYLATVLGKIDRTYPEAAKNPIGDIKLSIEQTMILFTSIFMIIIGVLLIPVNLGMLPFSSSAQLGILMVIFAIQMLAFGNTPIGPFPRTWPMIGLGILFAVLGAISCIIPGILVSVLTILVGILNILGGIIALTKMLPKGSKQKTEPREPIPPILKKLFATQLTLNLLQILFGTSMLIPGKVPGMVIGVILAANGGVLSYLLSILVTLDKMRSNMEGTK
ncbi:MAG TPA: DUF308 domain-containing protein [Rectinema sp.]|nr:DUF308 domain-containing protein [Rectinema sp.]